MSVINPQDIVYKETFKIRAHEVDVNKRATIPAVLMLMQEASMVNAAQLNVSVWDLEKNMLSWVLLRKKLTILRLPQLGEEVIISTNPSAFDRAFAGRDYTMSDREGTLLAYASSTWTLLNMITKKMERIPSNLIDLTLPPNPLDPPSRKIEQINKVDIERTYIISYFDLDWNGHVNNINYIRFMLESLSEERLVHRQLKSIQFQIKSECFLSNELIIQAEIKTDREILHQITSADTGAIVSQGHSFWE